MKKILIINGANLNMTGKRNPEIYGTKTLDEINREIAVRAKELNVSVEFVTSNWEGEIIDAIHRAGEECDGIIINPGAWTHYSYAIRDALDAVSVPKIEVHISNIYEREEWRRVSVIKDVCNGSIVGKGYKGYMLALEELVK